MIGAFLLVLLYFVPSIIAKSGQRGSIFIINLFFGWTFIGWVIALFMAVKSNEVAAAR